MNHASYPTDYSDYFTFTILGCFTEIALSLFSTNMDAAGLDKSDFVNDWCNDTIRQFLDGKPLSSIQATTVTDRSVSF